MKVSCSKRKCSLCCEEDLLLKNDFGAQAIRNTFFTISKNQFNEIFITNTQFCVICTHKLYLSIQLKKDYDEMCNRNNKLSPAKCYFCENKEPNLIMLNDNPHNVHETINTFLNSVIIKHGYKNLKSCIRCLYNLDIWSEVRNNLYKSMNIPTTNSVRIEDATNNNVSPINTSTSPATSSRVRKQTQRNSTTLRNGKFNWKNYLREKLKKFKTVDKLLEQGNFNLNSAVIENDEDKLFNALPFVEIFLSSQITKEAILQGEEDIPTIVLSDSDEESDTNRRTSRRRTNLSLKQANATSKSTPKSSPSTPKSIPASKSTPTPKTTPTTKPTSRTKSTPISKPAPKSKKMQFKIKPPIKMKLSLRKPLNTEILESKNNSSLQETESSKDSSSEDESNEFVCNVCDKTFTTKCDYLLDELKHNKIQNLVVNVRRDRLFEKLKSAKIAAKDESLSTADVNRLLNKWLGNDAGKECEDADHSNEKDLSEKEESNGEGSKAEHKESEEDSPKKKRHDKEMNAEQKEENTDNAMEIDATSDTDKKHADEPEKERVQSPNDICSDENNVEISNSDSKDDSLDKNRRSDKNDVSDRISDKNKADSEENAGKSASKSDKDANINQKKTEETEKPIKDTEEEIDLSSDDDRKTEKSSKESPIAEKISEKANSDSASSMKAGKNLDFNDDSSNSGETSCTPVMSCEDLLNILETNIDSDVNEENTASAENDKEQETPTVTALKRKRDSVESESTPKKKKVRFAEKKEIFTPDKSGVVIEKIIENDVLQDDADKTEEDNTEEEGENTEEEEEEREEMEEEEREDKESEEEREEKGEEEEEREEKGEEEEEREGKKEHQEDGEKEEETQTEEETQAEDKEEDEEEKKKEKGQKTKNNDDPVLECEV